MSNQSIAPHLRRHLPALLFTALALAGLLPNPAQGATSIRLEFISAEFFGTMTYGTFYLRETDTALPIAGKQVSVQLNTTREFSGWQHYTTGDDGAVRFGIPRLRDRQGNLYDQCQLIGEFNVSRPTSDPGRELYPEYRSMSVARTIPLGASDAPMAIISDPIQSGLPVPEDCLLTDRPVRFESLSYARDSLTQAPNDRIDAWRWTITDPFGQTTLDQGPAINFEMRASGTHEVRLVVWDHNGRVAQTTRTFRALHPVETHYFGGKKTWGQCPGSTGATTLLTDAYGKLEIECASDSCMPGGGFRVRWRPSTGPVLNIAQCSYRAGENHGEAIWDNCQKRYTSILWRNEEGRSGINHDGPITDDDHNGFADVDIYEFSPVIGYLTVTRRWRVLSSNRRSVGEDRGNDVFWSGPAPEGDTLFCQTWIQKRPTGVPSPANLGANNGPSRARLLLRGTASTGSLTLRLRQAELSLPLASSLGPDALAQQLITALNNNPSFAAADLVAELSDSGIPGIAEIAIVGAVDKELAVTISGAQPTLRAFTPSAIPELQASWIPSASSNSTVAVSWPVSADVFQLEVGRLSGGGMAWSPANDSGTRTTNNGTITLVQPVDSTAEPRFFRMQMTP